MEDKKSKLLKLIMENPTLPIVFQVNNDTMCNDYGWTFYENFECTTEVVYMTEDYCYSDYDEVFNDFRDKLCDEDDFKDIEDDDEYDKAVEEWIEKYIKHYEAIVISIE